MSAGAARASGILAELPAARFETTMTPTPVPSIEVCVSGTDQGVKSREPRDFRVPATRRSTLRTPVADCEHEDAEPAARTRLSEKLDGIIGAVIGNNGRGLTVTTVRGFGRQFGDLADRTLGADMAVGGLPLYPRPVLLSKVRLDIVVLDQDVQAMVDAIAKHGRTGMIGDGKIWVSDVDSVLRVRMGEQDSDAV